MRGERIIEANSPHQCAVIEGSWAAWPDDHDRAWPGSVWRCNECGTYYRVSNTSWRQHWPGPFKRRKYRKAQEAK